MDDAAPGSAGWPGGAGSYVRFDGVNQGVFLAGDGNRLYEVVVNAAVGSRPVVFVGDPPPVERHPAGSVLPRRGPVPLGRDRELAELAAAVTRGEPAQVFGEPGIGRSSVLRAAAHAAAPAAPEDGVLFLHVGGRPLEDLLEMLVESFYQTHGRRLGLPEVAQRLASVQAVVVLDDLDLSRTQLDALLDLVAPSTIICSAVDRSLFGEGRARWLAGLDEEAGLALLSRELGRPLQDRELPVARRLVAEVDGHPLRLIQAAAALTEDRRALTAAAAEPDGVAVRLVAAASPVARRTAAALAVLPGTPVTPDVLAAVTGDRPAAVATAAEELQAVGLAEAAGPGTALAVDADDVLDEASRPAAVERWTSTVTGWVTDPRRSPAEVAESAPAVLAVARAGLRHGRAAEVVALARAAAPNLAVAARWGSWALLLDVGIHAARTADLPADEAYFLHEQGVRLLCSSDPAAAVDALREALSIREQIGDDAGTEVTRDVLTTAQAELPDDPEPHGPEADGEEPPGPGPDRDASAGFPTASIPARRDAPPPPLPVPAARRPSGVLIGAIAALLLLVGSAVGFLARPAGTTPDQAAGATFPSEPTASQPGPATTTPSTAPSSTAPPSTVGPSRPDRTTNPSQPPATTTSPVTPVRATLRDVTGSSEGEAREALERQGYVNVRTVVEEPPADYEPGSVYRTDPRPGTRAALTTTITLYVASQEPTSPPTPSITTPAPEGSEMPQQTGPAPSGSPTPTDGP